jgi:hypothetical protein
MNVIRSGNLAPDGHAAVESQAQVLELIRRDLKFPPDAQGQDGGAANNLKSLIHRVSGASIGEIDDLIAHLQQVREFLRSEGERVQREIAGYAHLSQATRGYVETISEQVAEWKSGMADADADRA